MRFENPFGEEDYRRADLVPFQPQWHADAQFVGVQAYVQFFREFLQPGIKSLIGSRSLREQGVIDILYGIVGFVLAINRLREPLYVQTIAACSRSIFELYVDLALISNGAHRAERFRNFPDVEKLRSCQEKMRFYERCPDLPEGQGDSMQVLRDFVRDVGPHITANVQEMWWQRDQETPPPPLASKSKGRGRRRRGRRPEWPRHWSGIREMPRRAQAAGLTYERLYWEFYAHLSWYVHTANVGTVGADRDAIHAIIARALELVRRIVPDAFRIAARETELAATIPDVDDKIDFLGKVYFIRIIALKLGQPERFNPFD